jgi:hypothetical protein
MNLHGLGVDEATSVLSISRAVLDAKMRSTDDASVADVLECLTARVAGVRVTNSSTMASSITPASTSTPLVPARIIPAVQTVPTPPTNSRTEPSTPTTVNLPSAPVSRKEKKTKTMDAKQKPPSPLLTPKTASTRPRADSLADVVSDKLSASGAADASGTRGVGSIAAGKPPLAPSARGSKRLRSASDEARGPLSSPLHVGSVASDSSAGGHNGSNSSSNNKRTRRSPSVA